MCPRPVTCPRATGWSSARSTPRRCACAGRCSISRSRCSRRRRPATGSGSSAPPRPATIWRAPATPRTTSFETDASKSFFVLDREACILCGRCTVACGDVQHIGAISLAGRGHDARVGVFGDGAMASSVCTSCGQCVATCPTGALRPKEEPSPIVREVETTCPYCGVGCGITLRVRGDGRLSDHGRRRARQPLEPRHALREGPLRHRLRPLEGPHHHAPDQARRRAGTRPAGTRRSTPPPTGWRATAATSARSPPPRPPTRTASSSRSSPGW